MRPRFSKVQSLSKFSGPSAPATSAFGLVALSTIVGAAASLIIAKLPPAIVKRPELVCAALLALMGLFILALAVAESFLVAAGAFIAVYFCLELRAPLAQTLLHTVTPSSHRASVLSSYSMSTNIGALLASVGLGAVAAHTSVPLIWLIAGTLTIIGGFVFIRFGRYR